MTMVKMACFSKTNNYKHQVLCYTIGGAADVATHFLKVRCYSSLSGFIQWTLTKNDLISIGIRFTTKSFG